MIFRRRHPEPPIRVELVGLGSRFDSLAQLFLEILKRLDRIEQIGRATMSKIQDFSDQVNAAFDKIGTAVDGLTTDIATLNAKITELQNSPGAITPEDQLLLDDIQAKATAAADKLGALDALTEAPPAPPAP